MLFRSGGYYTMKTCSKCGELNGDNRSTCYKCGTSIGSVASYKKKCPKCGEVFNGSKDNCDYCGERLVTYDENYYFNQQYGKSNSNTWMYVCTVIIPLLGIILGCVKMSNDKRDDSGKSLIILGVVLMVIYPILTMLVYNL